MIRCVSNTLSEASLDPVAKKFQSGLKAINDMIDLISHEEIRTSCSTWTSMLCYKP